MISKIYSLPISNSIILLYHPYSDSILSLYRSHTLHIYTRFLDISEYCNGRGEKRKKKKEYRKIWTRWDVFNSLYIARGGFRKIEKSLEGAGRTRKSIPAWKKRGRETNARWRVGVRVRRSSIIARDGKSHSPSRLSHPCKRITRSLTKRRLPIRSYSVLEWNTHAFC